MCNKYVIKLTPSMRNISIYHLEQMYSKTITLIDLYFIY